MSELEAPTPESISIEDEMRHSYLDYAMSVIIGRALPDVRDGLKPVHRRVLYAMHQSGNTSARGYRKSAKTVGEVIGKFHPHGDQAVYDTIVRMAQDFSLRYPLVDGQGNFGSIDGDPPAAMRYTEIRMSALAELMLRDIDKETCDFGPNYDSTEDEPLVLPSALPNLLVNGADGIAVGMATRIPPHNLSEIVNATCHVIDNPECTPADLLSIVSGPDFPTGGVIHGRMGIRQAYLTGRGSIVMRGVMEVEEPSRSGQRTRIVITELPYQVNKARLIEEIADLVRRQKEAKKTNARRIDGIADIMDIRDESDRRGIRVVIELGKGAMPKVVLNNLYKHTKLQQSFGANFLAIVSGRPRVLNLKDALHHFVVHRREVVVRRTQYLLRQAEARAHILEGLKRALDHLDEVIALIRAAQSPATAKSGLIDRFEFTEVQAQAILDMRLQRLTQLERHKLVEELEELLAKIARYKEILSSTKEVDAIVRGELVEVAEKHGGERRTRIEEDEGEIATIDMIQEEDVVVALSHRQYVRRMPLSDYRVQGRGGTGITISAGEDDFIERLLISSTHDTTLWFTSFGRVFKLPAYQVPEGSRTSRGRSLVNLLQLQPDERVEGLLCLDSLDHPELDIVTFTEQGIVKRTALSAYKNINVSGLIALRLNEGDRLIAVRLCREDDAYFVATREGKAIRFYASDVRRMGRTAAGVKAIALRAGDRVVSAGAPQDDEFVLTVTENGYGKRTLVSDYRIQGRGGYGLKNLRGIEKVGQVVGALAVDGDDEVVIVSREGKIIRTAVDTVSVLGRDTMGVRLMRVGDEGGVVSVSRTARVEGAEDEVTGPRNDEGAASIDEMGSEREAPESDGDEPGSES